MATSATLESSVNEWRQAADDLLKVAEAAAPLSSDEMAGLSLGDSADPSVSPPLPVDEEINRRVDVLIDKSEAAINEATAGQATAAAGLPALLGSLELANTLMAASKEPGEAFDALGLDGGGPATLTAQRQVLDEFKEALLGHSVTGKVALPDALGERMETLETKGADELLELGKTAVLHKVVGELASGLITLAGSHVKDAFEWAKEQARLLQKAAVRLLNWAVEKLRSMIPAKYRDQYDEKIKEIADKIKGGAHDTLANALGYWAGRREAERAWQDRLDAGADVTQAEAALPEVIAGHLKRIGYVGRGRVLVSGAVAGLRALTWFTGRQADVIVAAGVAVLMGVVWVQMVDGYNDIERLLPPAADPA